MSRIACIGSRKTPADILRWMEHAGAELVRAGHTVVSGNSPGADQAWARGGNSIDPKRVELCLPWVDFEQQAIVAGNVVRIFNGALDGRFQAKAAMFHPRWNRLTPGVKKLHARNVMIVQDTQQVLYYITKRSTSGTKFGINLAHALEIPVHNVGDVAVREAFDSAAINGPVFP